MTDTPFSSDSTAKNTIMTSFRAFLPAIVSIALLASCGGQQTAPIAQDCRYSYSPDSTSVKWTAYKFTEKVGVSGVFDTIVVTGAVEDSSSLAVFADAAFSIPVSSINSTVPDRDQKIREHFFGTMTGTTSLSGKVFSIDSAQAIVEITMNGQTLPANLSVTTKGNEVMLEGVIQLGDWGALSSVEALNKICHDLHIGADGMSLLWPEVKLEIRTVLTEKCD